MRLLSVLIFLFPIGCASTGVVPVEFSEKVSSPHNQEVCFSPDEPCDEKILNFVGGAQKSIDIAAYELTLKPLGDQLTSLAKKIPIRIVMDKKEANKQGSLASSLRSAGISVRYGNQHGLMHDKFTIIDGAIVETGSFNYTMDAVSRNQENQIYLAQPVVVERYKERFQKMWDTALKP